MKFKTFNFEAADKNLALFRNGKLNFKTLRRISPPKILCCFRHNETILYDLHEVLFFYVKNIEKFNTEFS